MSTAIKSIAAAALLLVAIAATAASQEPEAPDTGAAPEQAQVPEAPPGALEVAMRGGTVADSAEIAEEAVARLGSTEGLEENVVEAAQRQSRLRALLGSMLNSDYVRAERVSRLRDQVVLEGQELESLREDIADRLQQLAALRSTWVARRAQWQQWRQTLEGDPDLPAVEQDFAQAASQIDTVLQQVSARLEQLLPVQRRIEQLRTGNDELRETLSAMRSGGRAALLERSQPVLFSAEHRAQLAERRWRAWEPTASLQQGAYARFVRDRFTTLLFHLALALAIGLIGQRIRGGRRTVGQWSGLLDHPWALGAFASSVIAFQRVLLAPPLWDVLLWSIFGAAAAVLARNLFAAYALRLTVYLFAAFYPVFILLEAMQLPVPAFRTALAVVAAIALPGFAFMARRRTAIATAENVSDPRRIWPLSIGAIMWAVVLIAVVLGFDSLGRWVLHASVTSGAVVLVAIVLLALIRGIVASLVVTDPSIRRHLALRVAVRLAQRLIFIIQLVTVIAAVLVLLDVWQITASPLATWQAIIGTGFEVGGANLTIGRILVGILIIYAAVLASWLVRNIVQSEASGRWHFDRGVGESISKLVRYLLITIAFFIVLGVLGVELRNFALIAGALGVGIGFGLQNPVSNLVSGLILLFERPVRVGDTVVVGNEWGTIRKIGLRSTVMMTLDQSEMIVPNADMVNEKVVNWTLTNPTARIIMEVGVAYGTNIEQVLGILLEAGATHEHTLSDPPPEALFMRFGESSLEFELRVWVREIRNRLQVRSVVLTEIQRRFMAEGIEIPFPQRDLHIRSVDEGAARSVAPQTGSPAENDDRG